jgi:ring-1,2-phenylacetyl-CoA epoxidase subunit PaaB
MNATDNQGDLWEVFCQAKAGLAFKHMGSVHAFDKQLAIENARDLYNRRNEGVNLWVVKSTDIIAVQNEDTDEFFTSAEDKIYRHPTFFELPDGIKHM